jgi:hypothetical protein
MIIRNDASSHILFALKAGRPDAPTSSALVRGTDAASNLEWSLLYNAFISLLAEKRIIRLIKV